MFVPNNETDILTKGEKGETVVTQSFILMMQQLIQNMQQCLSEEGFVMPSQSAANANIIANGAQKGTVLFVADEVNGGSSDAPNGQLFVRLADGTFHAIPNL